MASSIPGAGSAIGFVRLSESTPMTVTIMPPGSDIFASGCEALVNPVDAATGAQGKAESALLGGAQRGAGRPAAAFAWWILALSGRMNEGEHGSAPVNAGVGQVAPMELRPPRGGAFRPRQSTPRS